MAVGVALAPIPAAHAEDPSPVTVTVFHGDGCPHCAAELEFLETLTDADPAVTVEAHEVWYDETGRDLLLQMAEERGFEPSGVPVTIIGDHVWIGFDDATADAIVAAIAGTRGASNQSPPQSESQDSMPERSVQVPIIGQVAIGDLSLLMSTVAIGFVDGVNPCSLWVLSLLLAMVAGRGSRRRVLIIGGVFLAITSAMYALYMLGMYSAASYLTNMGWLRVLVAVIAGTFGVLQFKDGLGLSGGPSLSISPSQRPGLYARIRGLASPDRALAATIAGTAALAVLVSLLETPCTAGLPLLWTTLLAEQGVGPLQAAGLFAVYMTVFLLDEFIVFAVAVFTLHATRLQERHGRALKLVAGSVLVCLAATMLLRPDALTTLGGTAVVFSIAGVIAAVAYRLSSARSSRASRSAS